MSQKLVLRLNPVADEEQTNHDTEHVSRTLQEHYYFQILLHYQSHISCLKMRKSYIILVRPTPVHNALMKIEAIHQQVYNLKPKQNLDKN